MLEENSYKYDLIITIVNKGFAEDVIYASRVAGAEGGTIMNGRGQGIHEKAKIFGISIEPEKDIVLTLIEKTKTDRVLKAINDAAKLYEPNKGVAFVLEVEKTAGIGNELKNYICFEDK